MKNKCTPWLAVFSMFRLCGSGLGGCRRSAARARQPGFCFFSGTSSLRAPHDVREPGARLSAWAHCWHFPAGLSLGGTAGAEGSWQPVLWALGSSEPPVILHQPCRTEHHHLLEVWRQHGSQGGNGTFLESGKPSNGYVWVEHVSSCFFLQCFWIELGNSGSQGAWLWWHLLCVIHGNLQYWWKAAGRSASIPGTLLSFLHPVGATKKAHPSLCVCTQKCFFCLCTIEEEMQNARFHLILPYKVNLSLLIWYRVTNSFLS